MISKQSPDDLTPKKKLILETALELLAEAGSEGLTMRKLAERSGMRLSNVQYHFKSRDDVLKAMVSLYLDQCTNRIVKMTSMNAGVSERERLQNLVEDGLSHASEISDMCRTFRELWAISSRDAGIHDHLMKYYSEFSVVVVESIFGDEISPASKQKVASLLIPYFEGYSVVAQSLGMDVQNIAGMITDFALQVAHSEAT